MACSLRDSFCYSSIRVFIVSLPILFTSFTLFRERIMLTRGAYIGVHVVYGLLDPVSTLLSLGFYGTNATTVHDILNSMRDQLLFAKGFDLRTTGVDFVVLSLLRVIMMAVGAVLVTQRRLSTSFYHILSLLFVGSISHALAKVLFFAEYEEQLGLVGVWLSIAASSTMAILNYIIWLTVTQKRWYEPETSSYAPLSESTLEVAARPNVIPKTDVDRESALKCAKSLFGYAAQQVRWFAAAFTFLLIYSCSKIFLPYYIGQVVASIVDTKGKSTEAFNHILLVMIGLALLSSLFGGFRSGTFVYISYIINNAVRFDLFGSIVKQEIGFFDAAQTGEIMSRISNDCATVVGILHISINLLARNGIMLIGSLVMMSWLSWRLTLITFIFVPPIALITKLFGSYFDKISERIQTATAAANKHAEEVISTMRTVRSFACEAKELVRYNERLLDVLKVGVTKSKAQCGYLWMGEMSENIVLISVLFYAGHLAMAGKLATSEATSFLIYQLQLGANFSELNYVMSNVMESIGASRKVLEYIDRKPVIKNDGDVNTSIQGHIHMENVSFAYPARPTTNVLENLDLDFPAGKTVALVGSSGAGKSSIIALIEHFYEASNGRVTLDGIDIGAYDHEYLHQQIALVAQEPVLYAGTIRFNILYGCEDWATDEDMIAAAKLANAHNFVTSFQAGYDTLCGEKGVQMSGGQKQRLAIARALVRRPAVLILDEATSALDSESEHLIQQALHQCSVGRTVLLIAHRLSTVESADIIYVLEQGKVVQKGPHQQLMAEKGLYRKLVRRQLLAGANHDKQLLAASPSSPT